LPKNVRQAAPYHLQKGRLTSITFSEDHSVVEDVVWGETMFSDKYGFAILKNLQAIQAEQICRTPEELKAVRDSYEKRMKEAKK
jgi:hypothetical protein